MMTEQRRQAIEAYKKQQIVQEGSDLLMLHRANIFARENSGCEKVVVGTLIIDQHGHPHYGANRVMPNKCKGVEGCQKDGHCTSTIHSEIDAIVSSKTNLYRSTIYVTRYPCESCARAIVTAGIKTVVYGRKNAISEETAHILNSAKVTVRHVPSFEEEDWVED